MSERNTYSIIRGVKASDARALIDAVLKTLPGDPPKETKWSDYRCVIGARSAQVLVCPGGLVLCHGVWHIAREIARLADAPEMELRVQEGNHWDFTVTYRGEVVVDFSTRVSYYNGDASAPRPWKQGDAQAFAEVWGVPLERVAPYLIDWDEHCGRGRVADGDQFEVGDWCQVFDFMRVIGIEDPAEHPERIAAEKGSERFIGGRPRRHAIRWRLHFGVVLFFHASRRFDKSF